MKRPVCVFCFTGLLTQLAAVCLPQAAFWPLAVFCVLACGVLFAARRKAVFPAVGAAILAGSLLFLNTQLRLYLPARSLAGRQVMLMAVVSETDSSYVDGMVSASLAVETVDGGPERLSLYCPCLPECEAGDRIQGVFWVEALERGGYGWSRYADGMFAQCEYASGFVRAGRQDSFRLALRRFGLRLSANIRRYLRQEEGGILAAMTTGDRRFLSSGQTALYRRAGIPHILVVSGLHVSVLCGLVLPRARSRRMRVLRAWLSMGAAVLLMGIVGFTPSVTRAGIAALILNLGVLLLQPGDSLTALAAAVFLMSAGNAYAVCDLALQLSFAATLGVLLGGEWTAALSRAPWAQEGFGAAAASALQSAAASLGAAVCTFPVLVFWGLNVSAVSLLANLLTLWLAQPILFCGLLTALCGLTPLLYPLQRCFGLLGALFVRLLTALAGRLAGLPGAQLYFETPYAGIAALAVLVYALLLFRMGCGRRRILFSAGAMLALAVLAGSVLAKDVLRVTLVGSSWSPAVVLTENGHAAVLYRGGSYNTAQIGRFLEQRGIGQIDLVVDLRYAAAQPCPLEAEQTLALAALERYEVRRLAWQDAALSLYSSGEGGAVWMDLGGVSAAAVSGTLETAQPVAADVLLAASGSPGALRAETVLTLHRGYPWLDNGGENTVYYGRAGLCLAVRPGKSYRITGAEHGG